MYAHLYLAEGGRVQDAFTSEVCGGWRSNNQGVIHVFMSSTVDWRHQLPNYRVELTRGGDQYWKEHDDELADKLLFIAENCLTAEEESMDELAESGLEGIPELYVKFTKISR